MKVLTIDRSKWRTGSGDPRVKTGVGVTSLKNEEGFMCCLGQICSQLYPELEIEGSLLPSDTNIVDEEQLLVKNIGRRRIDTPLTEAAAEINDGSDSIERKEEALYAIFANKGYNLKFKGEHYYERS